MLYNVKMVRTVYSVTGLSYTVSLENGKGGFEKVFFVLLSNSKAFSIWEM